MTGSNVRHTLCSILILVWLLPCTVQAKLTDEEIAYVVNTANHSADNGKMDEALVMIKALAYQYPMIYNLRLELAVLYVRNKQYDLARETINVLQDRPEIPADIRENIALFLKDVKVRKDQEKREKQAQDRHQWRPSVDVGLGWDSNVTAGPDTSLLPAGAVTITVPDSAQGQSDSLVTINAAISHEYRSDITVPFGNYHAPIYLLSKASIYQSNYNKIHNSDLQILSLSTGPVFALSKSSDAQMILQFDYLSLDDNHLSNFISLKPLYTHSVGKGEITYNGVIQKREYVGSGNTGLNSNFYNVGVSYARTYKETGLTSNASLHYNNTNAELLRNDNDGFSANAGLDYRYSNYSKVNLQLTYTTENHKGVEPTYNITREDRQAKIDLRHNWRLVLGSSKKVLSLGAYITYTGNQSTVSLYDYNRTQIGFNLSHVF